MYGEAEELEDYNNDVIPPQPVAAASRWRKVYIAGPIGGYANGNREAFETAEARLLELGYDPVNPHKISPNHMGDCTGDIVPPRPDGEPEEHRYGCYMRPDIRALLDCEFIFLIPGWQFSRGARVEQQVAMICGIPVVQL